MRRISSISRSRSWRCQAWAARTVGIAACDQSSRQNRAAQTPLLIDANPVAAGVGKPAEPPTNSTMPTNMTSRDTVVQADVPAHSTAIQPIAPTVAGIRLRDRHRAA